MASEWDDYISNGAKIEFDKSVHDFGTVAYGEGGPAVFEFTNTGNSPLIISNAKGSAGSVKPLWPKEPIAPGAKGRMTVLYDMKRSGQIAKSVTITSNAVNDPTKTIRLRGMVLPQAE